MMTPPVPDTAPRVLVLEPGRADRHYWRDLWNYRELFLILAWRDLAVRYKQTTIGVAWAVIRPAITVAIFTIVFSRVANLPSDGRAPYALLVFSAMIAWTLVSSILGDASASLVNNASLIGKVYFPRLIVPAATMVVALADAAVTLALFAATLPFFGFLPDWRVLLLPLFVAWALAVALGPALLLAALNVRFRDFRYVIPFVVQLGIYISPIGYSSTRVPAEWRWVYGLNPVAGVVDGFRWSLLAGETPLHAPSLAAGAVTTVVLLAWGVHYFRATERTFADVV
jgi:lipopolysaccharide transport system permease protein